LRIIAAEARAYAARSRKAARAEAEALVDRLVARLAGQAANFGAGLVVSTGARAEGEVTRTLSTTPGVALSAALEPERVKAWLLGLLDAEAALHGGWSTLTPAEAAARQRQAEGELARLQAEEARLLCEAREMGVTLDQYGEPEPGVTVADEAWRATHKVTEHAR
jgi:hypothetical protein